MSIYVCSYVIFLKKIGRFFAQHAFDFVRPTTFSINAGFYMDVGFHAEIFRCGLFRIIHLLKLTLFILFISITAVIRDFAMLITFGLIFITNQQ